MFVSIIVRQVYGAEATEAALAFYLVLGISGFLVTSATLTAVYLTLTKQVVCIEDDFASVLLCICI